MNAPDTYRIYGVTVRSAIPLACPPGAAPGHAGIELSETPPSAFPNANADSLPKASEQRWFQHMTLRDGTDYLRWSRLSEFLVSPDGRSIGFRLLERASPESFQTYLVSQTLSFALLKQGIEPLHATVAVLDGHAVAFLGDCGYGKSSLGAAFVRSGHQLLTDDVLVTSRETGRQELVLAHPGPARLKLFPKIAARVLGRHRAGARLNPGTRKLILPLAEREHCATAVPLKAIYILQPPAPAHRRPRQVAIRPFSRRQACLKLIANTFNTIITDPARLARLLDRAAELARLVPVKSLSYPRRFSHLPTVLAAIRKDLAR